MNKTSTLLISSGESTCTDCPSISLPFGFKSALCAAESGTLSNPWSKYIPDRSSVCLRHSPRSSQLFSIPRKGKYFYTLNFLRFFFLLPPPPRKNPKVSLYYLIIKWRNAGTRTTGNENSIPGSFFFTEKLTSIRGWHNDLWKCYSQLVYFRNGVGGTSESSKKFTS